MKKLFACDLDGTLLNIDHDTDDRINEGIVKVVESGHYFTLATGRNIHQIKIIDFPEGIYIVCLNGALIVDPQGKVLYENVIDSSLIQQLLDIEDASLEFVSADGVYCPKSYETHKGSIDLDYLINRDGNDAIVDVMMCNIEFNVPKEEILKHNICKVNMHMTYGHPHPEVEAFIQNNADTIVNAATTPALYELTSNVVNKGKSVEWLAYHLGLDKAHVQVYGDAGNDIEMLKNFKYAFVPENGFDCAKEYAYEIIGNNNDYSVIDHIVKSIEE